MPLSAVLGGWGSIGDTAKCVSKAKQKKKTKQKQKVPPLTYRYWRSFGTHERSWLSSVCCTEWRVQTDQSPAAGWVQGWRGHQYRHRMFVASTPWEERPIGNTEMEANENLASQDPECKPPSKPAIHFIESNWRDYPCFSKPRTSHCQANTDHHII